MQSSTAARASPTARAAVCTRAMFSHAWVDWKPSPPAESWFATGTRRPSNSRSQVTNPW